MKIIELIRKITLRSRKSEAVDFSAVKWFPSDRSCVKSNMKSVDPAQMPPLMVRKAAWRR